MQLFFSQLENILSTLLSAVLKNFEAYWRTTSKPLNAMLFLSVSLRATRSNPEPFIGLLLNLLFPNVWFFVLNSAKTCWMAKNASLIRCLGFAERERDLWIAYFSSFFPLKLFCLRINSITASLHKSTGKSKRYYGRKCVKKTTV